VEKRLLASRFTFVGKRTSSKNVLNFVHLNLEVTNVTVLAPNWSGNLEALVIVNTGGSTIVSVIESVKFPLVTSIWYEPALERALGVKVISVQGSGASQGVV
jgi:hypothetical protein